MELRKEYKAPYYAVVVLSAIVIFFFLFALGITIGNKIGEWLEGLLIAILYISVILGTALAYWNMRTWKLRKLFVWLHIGILYIRIILMPLLDFQIFLDMDNDVETKLHYRIQEALPTLYWVVAVIAYIPFIIAVIEGYRRKVKSDQAIHVRPTS